METTPAIRSVSETDDIHTVEMRIAYGGPFNGRDTYGTIFSARTDWGLDLHPEGIPILYDHGLDPDFGLTPIGRTEPTANFRSEADGLWVRGQLDKRHKYYETRVKPLLDASGVGVSQGSAPNFVRIDVRSGDVKQWGLNELSFTPVESNPWSVVATRSDDIEAVLRIVAHRNDDPTDPEAPEPAVRAGKRNSTSDQGLVDQIHDLTVRLGATAHPGDEDSQPNDDSPPAEEPADATRSGESLPTLRIVEREDPVALRAAQEAAAARIGLEVAERFRRP